MKDSLHYIFSGLTYTCYSISYKLIIILISFYSHCEVSFSYCNLFIRLYPLNCFNAQAYTIICSFNTKSQPLCIIVVSVFKT